MIRLSLSSNSDLLCRAFNTTLALFCHPFLLSTLQPSLLSSSLQSSLPRSIYLSFSAMLFIFSSTYVIFSLSHINSYIYSSFHSFFISLIIMSLAFSLPPSRFPPSLSCTPFLLHFPISLFFIIFFSFFCHSFFLLRNIDWLFKALSFFLCFSSSAHSCPPGREHLFLVFVIILPFFVFLSFFICFLPFFFISFNYMLLSSFCLSSSIVTISSHLSLVLFFPLFCH